MNKPKKDSSPLLIWNIPKKIKKKFKAECAKKNKTMREVVIEYMDRFPHA